MWGRISREDTGEISKWSLLAVKWLRVISFKFLQQSHQKYYITQYVERVWEDSWRWTTEKYEIFSIKSGLPCGCFSVSCVVSGSILGYFGLFSVPSIFKREGEACRDASLNVPFYCEPMNCHYLNMLTNRLWPRYFMCHSISSRNFPTLTSSWGYSKQSAPSQPPTQAFPVAPFYFTPNK